MTDILDPPMPSQSEPASKNTAPRSTSDAKVRGPKHLASSPRSAGNSRIRRGTGTKFGLAGLIFIGVLAGATALLYGLWARDIHNVNVVRDVSMASRSISGQTPAQLDATLALIQAEFATTPVTIATPTVTITAAASKLGITIDSAATRNRALAVGHRGSVLERPWNWLGSMVGADHNVPLSINVDQVAFADAVRALERDQSRQPVNADVTLVGDKFAVTQSLPGNLIGLDGALKKLRALNLTSLTPISVSTQPVVAPAAFGDGDAQILADRLNTLAAHPLTVSVGGNTKTVDSAVVRSWLKPVIEVDHTTVALDGTKAIADLTAMFGDAGKVGTPPTFKVDYPNGQGKDTPGVITIVPGTDSTVCCEAAPSSVLAELSSTNATPIVMNLRTVPGSVAAEAAKSLGITERISWFQTPHNCCENRVVNINLMSDAVRGAIIQPGETFSLNKFVGERTPEKGYLKAAGIWKGAHVNQYGGGVSQLTTTLFNAAFFAGMDITDYKMHSEYFTRYPFGREATLSWTSPDLKIKNISTKPIMIWTYYSGTQVTVEMYGTKFVSSSEQSGQTQTQSGTCISVATERTRVFLDGTKKIDYFYNTYTRPLEEDCIGTPAKKYDDNFNEITTTTTTTLPTTTLPTAPSIPSSVPPPVP